MYYIIPVHYSNEVFSLSFPLFKLIPPINSKTNNLFLSWIRVLSGIELKGKLSSFPGNHIRPLASTLIPEYFALQRGAEPILIRYYKFSNSVTLHFNERYKFSQDDHNKDIDWIFSINEICISNTNQTIQCIQCVFVEHGFVVNKTHKL